VANFLKPFVNWVAKHYGDNVGKMLIHTGVVGWILSSAAQVVAIVINDEIPKKQKITKCSNLMLFRIKLR
jgi:hypothetical protein